MCILGCVTSEWLYFCSVIVCKLTAEYCNFRVGTYAENGNLEVKQKPSVITRK